MRMNFTQWLEQRMKMDRAATKEPWAWRSFGNEQCLVADHGDRKIMISGGYTRDGRHGVLFPMKKGQPVSDLIVTLRNENKKVLEALRKAYGALKFYGKGEHQPEEPTCWCQEPGVRQKDLEDDHKCTLYPTDFDPGEDGERARGALKKLDELGGK